jgi:hypothetical protein
MATIYGTVGTVEGTVGGGKPFHVAKLGRAARLIGRQCFKSGVHQLLRITPSDGVSNRIFRSTITPDESKVNPMIDWGGKLSKQA